MEQEQKNVVINADVCCVKEKEKKPKEVILPDGKMSFKDFCVMFKVRVAWVDGVRYRLPESWNDGKQRNK